MSNQKSYDLVVVGAGNAALCAAISAREEGAEVLVLEKGPKHKRGSLQMGRSGWPIIIWMISVKL
jgi:succinate dehydrogenase/fumarate reductase flavoprotein subunit